MISRKLKLGELFAGTGGLGLAVEEVFDAELAWYAEFEDAPSKIMAHHWPGVPNHRDVTTVDWSSVEPVDIISGGSPCQDLSAAGRRAGMTEGTRSNLWVSMREAIATIKPKYVVWENVRGAYSAKATSEVEHCPGCMGEAGSAKHHLRAFGRVLGDLSDLGFDAEWRGLPASDEGAPHARYRAFILATRRGVTKNPNGLGSRGRDDAPGESERGGQDASLVFANGATGKPRPIETLNHWGEFTPAIRRWEAIRGTAPLPTQTVASGRHRVDPAFVEWMMGLDTGHVTGVPGLTNKEQLKALGNGVVPQQAVAALKNMLEANK